RVDHFLPKGFQRRQRAALVLAHQPRVARNVSRYDGGKAALLDNHALLPASPAARRTCWRRSALAGSLYGIIASTIGPSRSGRSAQTCASAARASSVRPMAASTAARARWPQIASGFSLTASSA